MKTALVSSFKTPETASAGEKEAGIYPETREERTA